MFTGLIEDVGTIVQLSPIPDGLTIGIESKVITDELKLGDSVAVNGVCLTVTKIENTQFTVEAVLETLQKSTLKKMKIGSKINLERAIRFGDRMGGHFVQGHVDGKGTIQRIKPVGSAVWFGIKVSDEFDRYIIHKGSIAIDGISLTVAEKSDGAVKISVIPHTYQNTNLTLLKEGDSVNIELDMMAKYIENMVNPKKTEKKSKITESWLREQGFA
jgi:riboflavin synthase